MSCGTPFSRVDGFAALEKGEGWVQVVFFYINEDGEFAPAADVGWVNVEAAAGR